LKPRQSRPLGNGDVFQGCLNNRATIQDVHYLADTGIGPPPAGVLGEAGQTIYNDINGLANQLSPFFVQRLTRTSTTPSGVRFEWTLQAGPGFHNLLPGYGSTLYTTLHAILADALEGLVQNGTQSIAFSIRDRSGRIVMIVILRFV
jgi:hypothetical protein